VDPAKSLAVPNYCKVIRNSKFRCLFEATSYHHDIFTFALFLSEGRTGLAWEPSNKVKLFLPREEMKCLSILPLISSLHLLGFKWLTRIYHLHYSIKSRQCFFSVACIESKNLTNTRSALSLITGVCNTSNLINVTSALHCADNGTVH
jgi:hypothetical protein